MESSSAIRKGRQSDEGDEKSVKFRDDIGSASGRQLDPQAALFSQQFVNSITVDWLLLSADSSRD